MTFHHTLTKRRFAEKTAPLMFWLALLFLVGQSILVVLWFDVPNLREAAAARLADKSGVAVRAGDDGTALHPVPRTSEHIAGIVEQATRLLLLGLWPIFVAEAVFHWLTRPWSSKMRWFHFTSLLFCLCPSLRMCARTPELDGRMWLPTLGWRMPDKRLRRHLERRFSIPMILIAMLILPVLIVEFFLKQQVAEHLWLRSILHVGTGVIWFAFASEFILMISVAEKKLRYLKEHWIDLAIILLPLISFLRTLQLGRASRLLRLGRFPQVARLARIYRLRGMAVRALRALLVLNVLQRIFRRDRVATIEQLEERMWELRREQRMIQRQIFRLRSESDNPQKERGLDTPQQREGVEEAERSGSNSQASRPKPSGAGPAHGK